MRKVKFLYVFVLLMIAALASWNVNYNSQTKGMSDLALVNVEALAWEFNGQDWDDDHHWYNLGNDWSPHLHPCTGTSGGGQICIEYILGICINWGTSNSWNGQMVSCVFGSGNCYNGTDCIPD